MLEHAFVNMFVETRRAFKAFVLDLERAAIAIEVVALPGPSYVYDTDEWPDVIDA
jgi:hypothetical protein